MKPPITDVTEAREIAVQWQSPGTIGRVLAAFASGLIVDRWRLINDAEATKRESPGMALEDWFDLDRLIDWAKEEDDHALSGPPGSIRVITNHRPRDIVRWWTLSADDLSALGYGTDDEQWLSEREFVRFKGEVIDISDRNGITEGEFARKGWDSYASDSFFSGLVFRYVPDTDYEQVIIGRYIV